MDDITKALLLGVVQGLTEFLPVSSTGHLVLAGHALEFTGTRAKTFDIVIQGGTVLSVLVLYWRRFLDLIPGASAKRGPLVGWRGILLLLLGCLPAFIAGPLLHGTISRHLFTPETVAIGLIVGGLLLVAVERLGSHGVRHGIDAVTRRDAATVGVFQVLSLWPGMSRSGSCMIGALFAGLDRKGAAEFSFILAVPVLSAAVLYELLSVWHELLHEDLILLGVGFITAFFAGILSMRVLVRVVQRFSLVPFAIYRVVLGGVVLWFV